MKMVRNLFLTLILVSVSVFAAGIPEVKNTDNITMGRGANGDDKEFIFNIGDGATNPKLLINDILKVFNFNKGLDVTGAGVFSGNISGVDGTFTGNGDFSGANLKVGPGTNTDQFMSFKISGEEVGFKFDAATGEVLQKKKAGDAYKKLGTGSGSASTGINAFGEDDNANAEDGTTSWSNTGGTFISFEATGGDAKKVIEGERSFRFTPSAQNDVVVGPTLNFDFTKFHGRTCELGIEYTGADENLELHIVDGNGDILNEDLPNNRKIQARTTTTGPFSVSFLCPTAAAIGGDANKGNLHVEIKNVGAGVSPAIDWDLTFAGTDRNLGTTTLPDLYTITVSDTGAILDQTPEFVDSCSFPTTGNLTCIFKAGIFTETPYVSCTPTNDSGSTVNGCEIQYGNTNSSQFNVKLEQTSSSVFLTSNSQATIFVRAKGADAKKTVETYKASPVTTETENIFSAQIDLDATIISTSHDWLDSCSDDGTGDYSCVIKTGIFKTVAPACVVSPDTSSTHIVSTVNTVSTTSVTFRITSSGNSPIDRPFAFVCNKQGADVVKPQTKNLSLAGIAVNSYAEQTQRQVRTEACFIESGLNGGVPITDNVLCDTWIDSITDNGAGNMTVNFVPGTFSLPSVCNCNSSGNADCAQTNVPSITSAITLRTRDSASNSLIDNRAFLTCTGVK